MKITDAHAHFTFKQFDKDLDNVVKQMEKAGVWKIINHGIDLEDNKKVLALAEKYDIFLASLGIYPTHIVESSDREIQETFEFIRKNKNKIVAIGEVGLDHYHSTDKLAWAKQEKYFEQIVALANEIRKPIVVHSRKAEEDIFKFLKASEVPVVMHCFSGPAKALEIGLERDYYFTVPCSLKRNKNQRKVAKRVPLNRLLTETDAPYLAPELRDRNTSANIKFTISEIAKLRNTTESKIEKAVLENFNKLFL